ncbi:MAG: hypothetical protein AAB654_00855 [Acidobacteriota bacterium]
MARERKPARKYAGEGKPTPAQRDTLFFGMPILDDCVTFKPFSYWLTWRTSDEARALWKRHRRALLAEYRTQFLDALPWACSEFDAPAVRRALERRLKPKGENTDA